nr:hypothetical protein [Tanacetum cinerariifolium]
MSVSALMKCTAAIRQFAYGSTADAFDEYLQMSEHTARDDLFFFNMCIMELYMPKYLRKPTSEDVVNIQQNHNNVHGFSGRLGSIDCMHWEWKKFLVSWQGQYGRVIKKYPTIMLEVVALKYLWIRHAFYGIAGANNDINVLDKSPLFEDLLDDLSPVVPYLVKKVHEKMSNVLSVFSKDVGDLFNNQSVHTKSTHYVESCQCKQCGSIDVKPNVVKQKN